jgi:hypothetical protein
MVSSVASSPAASDRKGTKSLQKMQIESVERDMLRGCVNGGMIVSFCVIEQMVQYTIYPPDSYYMYAGDTDE